MAGHNVPRDPASEEASAKQTVAEKKAGAPIDARTACSSNEVGLWVLLRAALSGERLTTALSHCEKNLAPLNTPKEHAPKQGLRK